MDRAELEGQLEQLHATCWGWALACGGRDRDLAEDALQAAYLKVLSGQARFDGRSAFRTWMFGVIRLTTLEEMRGRSARHAREVEDERELDQATDSAATADHAVEQAQQAAAVLAALSTLSLRQREIMQLVFYHGTTIEEAAHIMQISVGSARTHYDRGKKAFALAFAARPSEAQ